MSPFPLSPQNGPDGVFPERERSEGRQAEARAESHSQNLPAAGLPFRERAFPEHTRSLRSDDINAPLKRPGAGPLNGRGESPFEGGMLLGRESALPTRLGDTATTESSRAQHSLKLFGFRTVSALLRHLDAFTRDLERSPTERDGSFKPLFDPSSFRSRACLVAELVENLVDHRGANKNELERFLSHGRAIPSREEFESLQGELQRYVTLASEGFLNREVGRRRTESALNALLESAAKMEAALRGTALLMTADLRPNRRK